MVAPDVQIEDGKGTILISSEEGETEGTTLTLLLTCNLVGGGMGSLHVLVWCLLSQSRQRLLVGGLQIQKLSGVGVTQGLVSDPTHRFWQCTH